MHQTTRKDLVWWKSVAWKKMSTFFRNRLLHHMHSTKILNYIVIWNCRILSLTLHVISYSPLLYNRLTILRIYVIFELFFSIFTYLFFSPLWTPMILMLYMDISILIFFFYWKHALKFSEGLENILDAFFVII